MWLTKAFSMSEYDDVTSQA